MEKAHHPERGEAEDGAFWGCSLKVALLQKIMISVDYVCLSEGQSCKSNVSLIFILNSHETISSSFIPTQLWKFVWELEEAGLHQKEKEKGNHLIYYPNFKVREKNAVCFLL